jgi:superfamily II DNA or RNA helicase
MNVQLRPYQSLAVAQSFQLWEQKILNLLGVAAVGAGKTIIASTIIKRHLASPEKRVLFLAHREELLDQTVEKLAMTDEQIVAGIEQGPRICPKNAQVMVASVATVKNLQRLTRWSPLKNISLVIVDECHHATAPTYLEVLDEISKQNPGRHLLGITATPIRMDGESLSLIFDALAFRVDMPELLDLGYLCPIRGLTIRTNISVENVPIGADGDYDPDELAQVVDTEARNRVIVQSYLAHGEGRPAIVFVANVHHAEHVAAEFRRRGINAQAVSGKQKKDERRKIIDAYQRGSLQVLTNCNVLTEGFDVPHTSCIVVGRPTRSPVTYPQQIGRGLRLHATKSDCLVIDLVDMRAQGIITLPKLFRLPETLRLEGENIRQVQRAIERARPYHPELDWGVASEFTARDLRQLLAPPDFYHLAQTLQPDSSTGINWMPLNDDLICVVDAREKRVAQLQRDSVGKWHFAFGHLHLRLGIRKQEALADATALLRTHLTETEIQRVSSQPQGGDILTQEQRLLLQQYQISPERISSLSEPAAVLLLQRLDFIKHLCRIRGMYQAGRYPGQFYEMVALFDPDYTEAVARANPFIAQRIHPLKILHWLKSNKPELFGCGLLPAFEQMLDLCKQQPNRFQDLARTALEGSPEFLHMQTQFERHRAAALAKRAAPSEPHLKQALLPDYVYQTPQ